VVAYHEREAASKAAAAELDVKDVGPSPQVWTAPDGTKKVRMYKRACPGINGEPCPHGSHLRKDSGKVCSKCRQRLVWNGLVPANAARHHLRMLSKHGVGYKTVADAAGLANSVVGAIMRGKKKCIRAKTERAILEVDEGAMADHGLVDAGPVWEMIDRMVRKHGFTRTEIARRLGYKGHGLQFGKRRVLAKTAFKVQRLHDDAEGVFLRGRR
jgi:hypothetical protein